MKLKLTEREKALMYKAVMWKGDAMIHQKDYGVYTNWLNENEQRLAESAPTVDCKQCTNRGQLNGTSQELVCDSCIHYGTSWRKDMFVPMNNGE